MNFSISQKKINHFNAEKIAEEILLGKFKKKLERNTAYTEFFKNY